MKRRPVRHSTVPPLPAARRPPPSPGPSRRAALHRPHIGRIIDQSDSSLLDVLDNLLNRGVLRNAEITLALADVDLVYVRLSAILCAADRIFPRDDVP